MRDGLVKLALAGQNLAKVEVGIFKARPQSKGLVQMVLAGFELTALNKQLSEIAVRDPGARIIFAGLFETSQRCLRVAASDVDPSQIRIGAGIVRPFANRVPPQGKRILIVDIAYQHSTGR